MSVLLANTSPPEQGVIKFNVQREVNIVFSATKAKRCVSVYVGDEIADLLHGETPTLVLDERASYWRVPVVLSSRTYGRIGIVGHLDVDVVTGDIQLHESNLQEIRTNAERLAIGAAL
jgi:hypothetical protein